MVFLDFFIVYTFATNNLYASNKNLKYGQPINPKEFCPYHIESYGNLTLYNCIFNSIGDYKYKGGAIYLECNIPNKITKCCFYSNWALTGGAIYISSPIKINSFVQFCVFENNYALEYGGALYIYNSNFYINNCNFTDNYVNKSTNSEIDKIGGAIMSNYSMANMENIIFKHNYVLSNKNTVMTANGGGAIYFNFSNYTITSCSFNKNWVYSNESGMWNSGGAISSFSSNQWFISNCDFINNSIIGNGKYYFNLGGGVFSFNDNNVTIIKCNFIDNSLNSENNESYQFGGALNILESNTSIKNCIFINNYALYGLDIFITALYINISIINCNFDQSNDNEIEIPYIIGIITFLKEPIHMAFKNNKVNILNKRKAFVFSSLDKITLSCDIENNCIYPYNKELLTGFNINFTDSNGEQFLEFNQIFDAECNSFSSNFLSPTSMFSKIDHFQVTSAFSNSDYFQPSSIFTNSDDFTKSSCFENSDYFSPSSIFTFSYSLCRNSNYFTPSLVFYKSKYFQQSLIYYNSDRFSHSTIYSNSNNFFKSQFFTKSKYNLQSIFSSQISHIFISSIFANSNYRTNHISQTHTIKSFILISRSKEFYSSYLTKSFDKNDDVYSMSNENTISSIIDKKGSNNQKTNHIIIFVIIIGLLLAIIFLLLGIIIFKINRKKMGISNNFENTTSIDFADDLDIGS